jgi:hypothetical protein
MFTSIKRCALRSRVAVCLALAAVAFVPATGAFAATSTTTTTTSTITIGDPNQFSALSISSAAARLGGDPVWGPGTGMGSGSGMGKGQGWWHGNKLGTPPNQPS